MYGIVSSRIEKLLAEYKTASDKTKIHILSQLEVLNACCVEYIERKKEVNEEQTNVIGTPSWLIKQELGKNI